MAADLKEKILTVLGPVAPSEAGITLPHEHLFLDFTKYYQRLLPQYYQDGVESLELRMENMDKIIKFPYSVRSNLVMNDEEEIISELQLFRAAGGSTVCDVTTIGFRINSEALLRVSEATGVNIVAGTGFYLDSFLSEERKMLSVREMADVMVGELVHGIGDSGVQCGVIGEVGCSWPLADSERRSLQAAALAQRETGAPLIVHPGRSEKAPFEIIDILEAAGANTSRMVMSHLDRTIFDDSKLLELARRGCYLEYDFFGLECSNHETVAIDMPSDAQRVQKVKTLVEAGYAHRVMLSHDIHTKHRLVCYGGHGYAHILEHIVPKMVDRGISRDVVMEILTDNPRRWLTFT